MSAQTTLDTLAELQDLAARSGYPRYDSLFLLAELVRTFQPQRVLELGVLHGCSSIFIARELAAGGQLVGVDSFKQTDMESVRATLEKFRVADRIKLITGDTRQAGSLIRGPFDMVFFDASHTSADLLAEYASIKDKLAHPAVLVIDDALCVPGALAEIGRDHAGMRAYSVHFGLCVVVHR